MTRFAALIPCLLFTFPLVACSGDEGSGRDTGGNNSGVGGASTGGNVGDGGTVGAGGSGGVTGVGGELGTGATGTGAQGSGSAAGTGGVVATGGTGGSTTGNGPCGAAGITFCTDFEDQAIPSEFTFWPDYLMDSTFFSLDTSASVSGSQSLKVTGTDFTQMYAVPVPASTFWGRVQIMSDTDIQSGHNTYVAAIEGTGDPNSGEAIRIGEHQCQLELNRRSDDAELLSNGGTYQCSGGIHMDANQWYCLEFYYDGPGSEVRVFVDGNEVTELHATDWGPYDYQVFKFGFEKYHGDSKNLWYDDLALGTERIGCN